MTFANVFFLRAPVVALIYLAAYVALDWISFIEPLTSFGITPWNPSTGLSFVLVLLFGQRFLPLLFVAPFLANQILRDFPLPWAIEVICSAIIGGVYSIGLMALLRPKTGFNPSLFSSRDVMLLMSVAAVSSAVVGACYVSLLTLTGFIPAASFFRAALRFWIGDLIGIAVVVPFALIILTRGPRLRVSWQMIAQVSAIVAALALVTAFAEKRSFEFFYLLFLPVVWMAISGGLELVTVGLLLTQVGLIVSVHLLALQGLEVASFQALMLVLALTGLAAGAVVTEHRRSEDHLRSLRESLAHVSRLGSMGELAGIIAHEINQPLMAAGTYARLLASALNEVKVPADVLETAQKAVAQVQRAADVVRQLRALIRLDHTNRAPVSVERIIGETVALYAVELERQRITVKAAIEPGLPYVVVDLLQIEQALLNVLKNSAEAIAEIGGDGGHILIDARPQGTAAISIDVHDNGPGFSSEIIDGNPASFQSRKLQGLGIGLSLCRSIVESHGGELQIFNSARGANVRFSLPVAAKG